MSRLSEYSTEELELALRVIHSNGLNVNNITLEIDNRKHAHLANVLRDVYYSRQFEVTGNDGFIRVAKFITSNYTEKS